MDRELTLGPKNEKCTLTSWVDCGDRAAAERKWKKNRSPFFLLVAPDMDKE